MANELERQLLALKQGDHVCAIYETVAERQAVAIPCVQQGLARGDRCLYIGDDDATREFAHALASAGVDVSGEQQRGALRLLSQRDSYLRFGEFTPQAMLDFLRGQESEAKAESRSGLRVVGEMTWALGPEVGGDRLIEYEAQINDYLRNSQSVIVCQYDRHRFDPSIIRDVLRTHPVVILGEQVCPNPFYEPPQMVLGRVSAAEQVEWRIAQLKQARSLKHINQQRHVLLQAVVEGMTDALFVKDRQGRYLMINSAGAQVIGKSVDEVVGKNDLELFAPEAARLIMDQDRQIMATRRTEAFEQAITAAGVNRIWLTTKTPYCDEQNEVLGLIGIARDITESKRLETERKALFQRLRLQIDRLPLAFVLLDASHRVVDWNPAAEQTFGYSKSEVIGRIIFELILDMPIAEQLQELIRRLEAGDMHSHSVNKNRTKDGRIITCEWFNTPLINADDGEYDGLISVVQNVSERQRADEALRQYAERLEILSRRVLEVQEQERRHLARELHDEIGQVLSTVSVNLHVVMVGCEPAARPRLEESIGIIDQAIQQVRTLSLDLRPSMLDDLGLFAAVRWFADRQAQRAGFVLHFAAESTGRRLPAALESAGYRVVQEAMTNIVRHARPDQVWVLVEECDDALRLEIRDDGAGFDVASALERAVRGESFGLLGMRERVQLLGGIMEIQSQPGLGTTIGVRFPINSVPDNSIGESR